MDSSTIIFIINTHKVKIKKKKLTHKAFIITDFKFISRMAVGILAFAIDQTLLK